MSKQYLDLTGLQKYDELVKDWTDEQIEAAIGALDTDENVTLASKSGKVITLTGALSETDGIVSGAGTAVTLAGVASTGKAEDVAIDDTEGNFTATDVEGALAELAEASAGGVASKTVYMVDESSGQSAYAKVYTFYQGADSSDMTKNTNLGSVNIPKDKVVQGGAVVDITYDDGKLYDGSTDVTALIKGSGTATAADAGKYIKLTLQNVSDPLYIAAKDLVDIYTAQQNATQVQLAISNSNVISAEIVDGSVDTDALGTSAVTTAKIADDAVTADKVAITAHTESQVAGVDGVSISVTTTDGQVSGVSAAIAANTYETYGSIASAIADLDATKSQTAGSDGLALSITETDGKITSISGSIASGTYEEAGAVSTAIAALDASESQTAGADGLALSVTEVDGVITSISGSIAANTYDAYGSASSAQTAAEGYTDSAIAGLDATASQTASTDGLALSVTEVDGKITAISGSIAANTYEPYGIGSIADEDIEDLFS